eukprot:scaffold237743_cov18-Tisochrysis_lutea.AAC.3
MVALCVPLCTQGDNSNPTWGAGPDRGMARSDKNDEEQMRSSAWIGLRAPPARRWTTASPLRAGTTTRAMKSCCACSPSSRR